ncbi:MAG: SRPBCC family protein [Actinomycetota bacterium]|nr:SRPBCC family protein [Actinomycetota bacterium]
MQLEHSFTVPVPVDQAWRVLLDIEQIAPCMPGAVLDTVDGDDFTGRVKVKLGPISLTYKGKASFVKKDEATHTAVIDAAGKDQRGNGTAAATVTATLQDQDGSSTRVDVLTDLNITGKPAQFGRGVMVDVGNKLIGQFATCVESKLGATGDSAEGAESAPTSTTGELTIDEPAARGASGPDGAPDTDGDAAHALGRHAAETARAAEAAAAQPSDGAVGKSDGGAATSAPKPPPVGASAAAAKPRAVPSREPEPIDLLEVAGGSVVTRIGIPAAGMAAAVGILFYIIRKIRS